MGRYVIVDLEMCKVPQARRSASYKWSQETIQIGAVAVDERFEIVSEFCEYVHPEYGYIDHTIRNLTGICGYDVKEAKGIAEVLKAFTDWIPDDAVCVSWSNSDELQIRHEIESKDIHIKKLDRLLDNWQDCQRQFAEKLNSNRQYRLSEALIVANIIYEDGAHDGLVDARNTAMLFIKMKKEPVLQLNKYYNTAREGGANKGLGVTLGDLFPAMVFTTA